jgi:hypothetical protein
VHEDVVKHTVEVQLVSALTGFTGGESSSKVMGIYYLAVAMTGVVSFKFGHFVANEVVQTRYADAGFTFVNVVVIVAYVKEVVSVVKHANAAQSRIIVIFHSGSE